MTHTDTPDASKSEPAAAPENMSSPNDKASPDNAYGTGKKGSHAPSLPESEFVGEDSAAKNKKSLNASAMLCLFAVVALLGTVAGMTIFSSSQSNADKEPVREETVTVDAPPVTDYPRQRPPSPGSTESPGSVYAKTAAIMLSEANSLSPNGAGDADASASSPQGPSLMERRMMGQDSFFASPTGQLAGTGLPDMTGVPMPPAGFAGPTEDNKPTSAMPLERADALLVRGTFIRCVLQTRIITDIPGFTSCVVNEPVYSFNGQRLLVPKGSRVMGKYGSEPNGARVAVIWDRVVTPTGIDVNMASPGVDNLGGAGHPGLYRAHWGSRIGAAMLISLLSDAFKYAAAEHGPPESTVSNGVVTQTPFQSNTADTVQDIAGQAVRKSANRPATVTINQGSIVSIYVARDIDFSGVIARL
ncbi:type IV secretion system protein VirB10 [Luteibacter sp. Sphag1AF]|uniref:TrbI/VirB10 family protein n=1 Tax=Luteibacter sp. Sphag1AF TaxID=2587031 RepID=UPI001622150A|nr:TrbI/VirB10 family protein [Luteibacter sp. Sphag1AF]MBB3228346.1 type IV secretion system protein VirB10 [Luteibacter sp. Sphag1AF]